MINELSEISYSSIICLDLYNEPLNDKKLFARFKFIKSKLPKAFLCFNSNGVFLSTELLRDLEASGLDYINISLHTTKANSYTDEYRLKKLDSFYARLGFLKSAYKIAQKTSMFLSLKFKSLTLAVNTLNYDLYGTDMGCIEAS